MLLQGLETLHLRMKAPLRQRAQGGASPRSTCPGELGETIPASPPAATTPRPKIPAKGCAGIMTFGVKAAPGAGEAFIDAAQS